MQPVNPKLLGSFFADQYRRRYVASIVLLFLLDMVTYLAFSKSGGPQLVSHQDKYLHTAAFFVLFLVGHISLHFDVLPHLRARLVPMLCHCLLWFAYGAFIELVQKYLSYRSSSLADLVADAAGILIGAVFVSIIDLFPRRPITHATTQQGEGEQAQ